MADALVSAVVDQLVIIIKNQVQELREAVGVEKEIKNLSSKLKKIREVLDDAEKRSLKENGVKVFIETIKDFSYEVDDVLDEWRTRTLTQQMERSEVVSCSSFLPWCFHFKKLLVHRDIAMRIKELDSKLDTITKEKEQLNFVVVTHTSASHTDQELKRVTTSFDVDASKVQGRDIDATAIIRKLIEDIGEEEEERNGPLVVSIVGTGGIGKTALTQLVYGDERVKTRFDERVWICVSHPFDEIKIAKAIVESTTKSSTDLSQLEVLLQRIQSTLSEKRFLLVLDDVWTEEYDKWEPFKNSLKDGLPGSRILVTSRSVRVAGIMETVYRHELKQISDSNSWLLLKRIAFTGRREEDCEKLKEIGQKIAQKCQGLPLAVKVMGSLLRFKDSEQEWQNILDSQIWELEKVETDLFPHFYLSYDDLTPKMKQCFSYCAVFSKGYEIEVDKLIRIWMAQGYLTTTNGSDENQMELKGRELLGDLAMRSFFQDLEKDDMDSNIISCKVHDIVHNFAQFLTRNECYTNIMRKWLRLKTYVICHGKKPNIRYTRSVEIMPQGITKLTQLCTLSDFVVRTESSKLGNMKKLNQLQGNLSIHFIDDVTDIEEAKKAELRNKKHLKELHLDFSENGEVGINVMEALTPPPELQILGMNRYRGTQFPSWITLSLDNLRVLHIKWCYNCSSLPPLGKLPSLETLCIENMKEQEYVGREFLGVPEVAVAFPKLKKLGFAYCRKWEVWEDLKQEAAIMPCIREVQLNGCGKLKTVPLQLLKVQYLKIENCPRLKVY